MFSKCKVLVLFMVLGALAAPENIPKSSAPFGFVQVGVANPYYYATNGSYFLCKKLSNGKEGMQFSWSLPGSTARAGKLSVYSISGKVIKSFDLSSRDRSIVWNMPQGKMASGVYFAVLTYGTLKKNTKIVY